MKCIFFLLACLLILVSCDPMRRIRMKNSTKHDVEIIWTLKADSILSSPLFISNSTEIKWELKPGKPYNKINLSFGIGSWTPSAVQDLVDDLETLSIRWNKGELLLNTEEEIRNFLLPRRKGLDRGDIRIEVKE